MVLDERPVILVKQVHREALILGVRTSSEKQKSSQSSEVPKRNEPLPAARDDKNETISLGAPPRPGFWHLKSGATQLSIDSLASWVVLSYKNRCT